MGKNISSETLNDDSQEFDDFENVYKTGKMRQNADARMKDGYAYHRVSNIDYEESDENSTDMQQNRHYSKTENNTNESDSAKNEFAEIARADKNYSGYNFSGKNLQCADFSGADLTGADFSGAILSGASFVNANLDGAIMDGAVLKYANFTKAKMHNMSLHNADIEGAILLEADIDNLTLEELQELIEFLVENFPHKVNLARLNLLLLDLTKIDLRKLNLRGVDFTGVDFTNIDITELDLSECIITPEQIAQALGRVPTPLELRRILAPKKKKNKFKGIDFTEFFLGNNREVGVFDAFHSFSDMDKLLETGKKIVNAIAPKPQVKDSEILEKFEQQRASEKEKHNENLRRSIEENKRMILNQRKIEKQKEQFFEQKQNEQQKDAQSKIKDIDIMVLQRGQNER